MLKNGRVTAFTVSKLLKENQQKGGGGVGVKQQYLEAATGGVMLKKVLLNISQNSQESIRKLTEILDRLKKIVKTFPVKKDDN